MGKSRWGPGGQVVVLVRGGNLTGFVNTALSQGILLWDMKRSGEDLLSARVRAASVRDLRRVAKATGCRFRIEGRSGPVFRWRRLSRRKGLVAGFVAFCLALYVLSGFVWSIQVEGNRTVSSAAILQAAAAGGLTWGMPRRLVDPDRVEKAVRDALPEMAWVSLRLHGTQVQLEVVERTLPRPVTEVPNDIVAARAGLVREILVQKGQARVAAGETVRAGQVLISGVIEPPAGVEPPPPVRYVAAAGLVRARVWYEAYGEAPLVVTGQRPAGVEVVGYGIKIGDREIISLGPQASPFPLYKTETLIKPFPLWRNIGLPVEVVITRYLKYERFREVRDVDTARRLAASEAFFGLESLRYPGGTVVDRRVEQVGRPGPEVRERMRVEALEDIGVPRPLGAAN